MWCGKGSTGDEREMAKKIASSLTKSEFGVVYEGNKQIVLYAWFIDTVYSMINKSAFCFY